MYILLHNVFPEMSALGLQQPLRSLTSGRLVPARQQTLGSGLAKMLLTLQPFKTTLYVIVLVVRIKHEQPLVKLDCC